MSEWYTVKEIEPQTNKSYKTINRYINDFKQHLKIKKIGSIIHLDKESVQVLKKICTMYDSGLTTLQVKHKLKEQGTPTIIDVPSPENDENVIGVNLSEALVGLQREVREQKEVNEKLVGFVRQLSERLDDQDKTLKSSLERRDQLIVQQMRASLEDQQRLAIESNNSKDKLVEEQFENINQQLIQIQEQQNEISNDDKNNKQIELLANQLQEMKRAIEEVASSKETKKWWEFWK